MGRSQRDKGKRFERQIAAALREVAPTRRGWQTRSGSDEPDVICDALSDCWIECKTGARPNIVAAMEQARKAAPAGRAPIAITHWDRSVTLVTMDLDDWLEWVRERADAEMARAKAADSVLAFALEGAATWEERAKRARACLRNVYSWCPSSDAPVIAAALSDDPPEPRPPCWGDCGAAEPDGVTPEDIGCDDCDMREPGAALSDDPPEVGR